MNTKNKSAQISYTTFHHLLPYNSKKRNSNSYNEIYLLRYILGRVVKCGVLARYVMWVRQILHYALKDLACSEIGPVL